jgi:hypothetical protein
MEIKLKTQLKSIRKELISQIKLNNFLYNILLYMSESGSATSPMPSIQQVTKTAIEQ